MRENSKIQKLNFKIFKQLKSGGGGGLHTLTAELLHLKLIGLF